MKIRTISAADTAYLLRGKLGPIRAWRDFLSDCTRGIANIKGFVLMPCCKMRDDRSTRPRYALRDVHEFISRVLALGIVSSAATSITLDIDPRKEWFARKFDRHGAPMARLTAYTN